MIHPMLRILQNGLKAAGWELVHTPIPNWSRYRWAILPLFDHFKINCVLDVGANVGQFGQSLRDLGYEGWILSFEPTCEPRVALQKRANSDPKWRVFPYALGAIEGEAEIHAMAGSVFSSFLEPTEDAASRWDARDFAWHRQRVPTRRLDTILDECIYGIPDPNLYLKMDTQGFDLEVFRGAEGVLERISALQTEAAFRKLYKGMSRFDEVLSVMMLRGFQVVDFVPVTREFDGLRVIEMDCIMCRAQSSDFLGGHHPPRLCARLK